MSLQPSAMNGSHPSASAEASAALTSGTPEAATVREQTSKQRVKSPTVVQSASVAQAPFRSTTASTGADARCAAAEHDPPAAELGGPAVGADVHAMNSIDTERTGTEALQRVTVLERWLMAL